MKKLSNQIVEIVGIKHQDFKLQEEAAELLTEIIRLDTGRNTPQSKELIEEIADFEIIAEQYLINHKLMKIYVKQPHLDFENLKTFLGIIIIRQIIELTQYNIYSSFYILQQFKTDNDIVELVENRKHEKIKLLKLRIANKDLL